MIHSIECNISEKWWLKDKYLQQTTFSPKDVEKGFDAIIKIFDEKWFKNLTEESIISHQVSKSLERRDLLSLEFLANLGLDILEIKSLPKGKNLINKLKHAENYWGAYFEVSIIAMIKRHGYSVELEPLTQNRRRCEARINKGKEIIYLECKYFSWPSKKFPEGERWMNIYYKNLRGEPLPEEEMKIMPNGIPIDWKDELKDIVDKAIETGSEQLDKNFPGILFIESPLASNSKAHQHLEDFLSKNKIEHLSALVILNKVYNKKIRYENIIIQNPGASWKWKYEGLEISNIIKKFFE
jgi:hypothetical protein